MSKYLKDADYLFNVIAALVKKNGGELIITKEELSNISKGDLIGMYYEPKTGNTIFKKVDKKDTLQTSELLRRGQDTTQYEN